MNTPTTPGACLRVLCILCLASLSGCGGATSAESTTHSDGALPGRVPTNHRTSGLQCTEPAPAGTCSCNGTCPNSTCVVDSDCSDAGINGRCASFLGPAGCGCTYDACAGDNDCQTGQTCACHGSPYTFGGGNLCVPGNCRADADCGVGGYCSPTPALPCNAGGENSFCQGVGYYCHTPKDQCIDDSDCQGVGSPGCLYDPSIGYWTCQVYAQPL